VIAMLLVLLVGVGNVALGFGLAIYFGQGPPGLKLPTAELIRAQLRSLLRLNAKSST
jgi:hypothetical protein